MEPPVALPLAPVSPLLPLGTPFTPATAIRAGLTRATLERMLRDGRVRRLLRGVYVDATVPETRELRAKALALVVSPAYVVTERTAAWLHGVDLRRDPAELVPVDRSSRRLPGRDVELVSGVRVTTALRTALDLGRRLGPDRAQAAVDGLLALGAFPHTALLAEVARFGRQQGVVQLREVVARADARAQGMAETFLRMRWLDARLPTPTPGLVVGGVRLALGLPGHRFGAVLAGRIGLGDLDRLRHRHWSVVVVPERRVLLSDAPLVSGHLEREFHQHLLAQVG